MRPYLLFVFLVFFGVLFSFSPSEYLYPEEETTLFSYKNFTLNNIAYSIIYINNSEIFLLKNGELITKKEDIQSVLNEYFMKEYYPSEVELAELKSLITAYDKSRNDGFGTYKNMEEYACRQAVFTDKRIEVYINKTPQKLWCHDDESCKINAMLLYSYGYEQFHWSSYEILIQPLKDFSYSSYGTDEIILNYNQRLNNLSKENVVDTLTYMKSTIPILKSYADKIEASIFRYPRMNDSADKLACKNKCYAICPPFDIDQEKSLMNLKDRVDALYNKIQPLVNLNTTTEKISKNTAERIAFYENKKQTEKYNQIFKPLEKEGKMVEGNATEAYLLITDTELNMKKEEATLLRETIRNKIDSANFTDLDEDIAQYEDILKSLKNKTIAIYDTYKEIKGAKGAVIANLFEIGAHNLMGDDQKKYEEMKEQLQQIDSQMVPGLSLAKAKELKEQYSALANATAEMKKAIESSPVMASTSPLREFAVKTNNWLAYATTTLNLATTTSLLENKTTVISGFILLLFFSFLAIAFFVFLSLLKLNRSKKALYIFGGIFIVVLIASAFLAGSLLFLMNETSKDATLKEFYKDIDGKKTVAVVVDKRLATANEIKSIEKCAESIAKTLVEKGKTAEIIEKKNDDSCAKNNQTIKCEDINSYSAVIELARSETYEEPQFSITFLTNAKIKEPDDYYDVCPLAEMLK